MSDKSKNPILDRIKYLPQDIQYKILNHYLISEEVNEMQDEIMRFRIKERENKIDKHELEKQILETEKQTLKILLEKQESIEKLQQQLINTLLK